MEKRSHKTQWLSVDTWAVPKESWDPISVIEVVAPNFEPTGEGATTATQPSNRSQREVSATKEQRDKILLPVNRQKGDTTASKIVITPGRNKIVLRFGQIRPSLWMHVSESSNVCCHAHSHQAHYNNQPFQGKSLNIRTPTCESRLSWPSAEPNSSSLR